MDAFQRAYLDTLRALAGWRVAQDCESQVAHWLLEGIASHADLVDARSHTRTAHSAYSAARRRYARLASLATLAASPASGRAARRGGV